MLLDTLTDCFERLPHFALYLIPKEAEYSCARALRNLLISLVTEPGHKRTTIRLFAEMCPSEKWHAAVAGAHNARAASAGPACATTARKGAIDAQSLNPTSPLQLAFAALEESSEQWKHRIYAGVCETYMNRINVVDIREESNLHFAPREWSPRTMGRDLNIFLHETTQDEFLCRRCARRTSEFKARH